jgi:hypothetical protein
MCSVSKKIPEVLMSYVVPIPSFNCTGRASLKRSPLRLSSKPPAPPTVRRTMPVITDENNLSEDTFLYVVRYISNDIDWSDGVMKYSGRAHCEFCVLSRELGVWRLRCYFGVSSQFWFQGLRMEIKNRLPIPFLSASAWHNFRVIDVRIS